MTWKTVIQHIDAETGQLLYDLREFQEIVKMREKKTIQLNYKDYERRIFKYYRPADSRQQSLF